VHQVHAVLMLVCFMVVLVISSGVSGKTGQARKQSLFAGTDCLLM